MREEPTRYKRVDPDSRIKSLFLTGLTEKVLSQNAEYIEKTMRERTAEAEDAGADGAVLMYACTGGGG